MSPSLLTGAESGFGCARKKAICAGEGVKSGSLGRRNGGPAGTPCFEAEADCGAGRVAGTRVCAEVCLAESSQPPIAREVARETARATPMKDHSRFAYGYIKSGGPQADYGKERAAGRSTGSRDRVGGRGTGHPFERLRDFVRVG